MKSIKYPTVTQTKRIGDKLYVVEAIRDLDEAIDLLCNEMDSNQKNDPFAEDLCPYFGILWPSSIALGIFLSQHPDLVKGRTVLELGAGLGLPSLVASYLGGDVLATDYHPDVESYFLRNCRHSGITCRYQRMNWREEKVAEKFDVVIGSDILYEAKHASEVARGLLRFVKPGGLVILSDPGRAYLQKFIHAMKDEKISEEIYSVSVEQKDIFVLTFTAYTE
jgi:predicted nicotinamide N-methyase